MKNLIFKLFFDGGRLRRRALFIFLWAAICLLSQNSFAHQQPTTIVMLDVTPDKVAMELQVPLSELELAFGHDVTQNTDTLIQRLEPQLREYLQAHVRPVTLQNQFWSVEVAGMKVEEAEQTRSGPYQEITIRLVLTPPAGAGTRQFVLNYDLVMHQVVTHKALVGIRRDWESGATGEQPATIGVIAVDTETTLIRPLAVDLPEGDWWRGFKGMVSLGMQHVKDGADHLLFLLVLLLPAALRANGNEWGNFGGTGYGVKRLLKIVTAFTVGHSVTLLIGALGWLRLPQQPVEILIAVSILVSAVHAVRPVFPGKEWRVAAGFGLIHGSAFAFVLSNLNLSRGAMALSILGFNVGIELMQLFVIALVIPWLILLSLTPAYKWIRIAGAALASAAAVAWVAERVSGNPNVVGGFVQNASQHVHWGIFILALTALAAFGLQHIKNKQYSAETEQTGI